MACTDLENSLDYVQAGNLTLDGIRQVLSSCPQICDRFYGTEAFDLAGPGVQLSFDVQSLLIVIFGTLQSFISYILPPHASKSTKLIIARLQVIFDTIFGTITFLSICTMITSFIRLRQTPTAFERIMIQVLLDRANMCLVLGLIARMVQNTPLNIKQPFRRWHDTQLWLTVMVLGLIVPCLKSMSGKVPTAALSRLCAKTYEADHDTGLLGYPTVYVPPSGNLYLLCSAIIFFGSIGTAIASEYIRNSIWQWLKKVFTSRLSIVIFVTAWTAVALSGLGLNVWQILYLRQTMIKAGSDMSRWDLGQVFAVALWLPSFYQMILTAFISLEFKSVYNGDNFSWSKGIWNLWVAMFEVLCKSTTPSLCHGARVLIQTDEANVGDPPSIMKDPDEEEKSSKKSDDGNTKPKTPELEKAKSRGDEKVSMEALDLAKEKQENFYNFRGACDEKAPLMRDHDG